MPRLHLYRTDRDKKGEKIRVYIGLVSVDQQTFDDTKRNYRTTWCIENGYSLEHYLRVEKIIETTDAERQAFQEIGDRLKASGKLPSAAENIINTLERR